MCLPILLELWYSKTLKHKSDLKKKKGLTSSLNNVAVSALMDKGGSGFVSCRFHGKLEILVKPFQGTEPARFGERCGAIRDKTRAKGLQLSHSEEDDEHCDLHQGTVGIHVAPSTQLPPQPFLLNMQPWRVRVEVSPGGASVEWNVNMWFKIPPFSVVQASQLACGKWREMHLSQKTTGLARCRLVAFPHWPICSVFALEGWRSRPPYQRIAVQRTCGRPKSRARKIILAQRVHELLVSKPGKE